MTDGADRSEAGGWGEFSGHRLLVISAVLGLTTSMNAVMIYSLGSFIGPLNAEFGWDRGSISIAVSVLTFGVFLFGPIAGKLCDRFGAAFVGSISLLAYGLAVIVMTMIVGSLYSFWFAYFIIAMLGVGSTPIVLVRPITAAFDKRRGLALGIALTGAGLTGFWAPNVVTEVSATFGWRAGYWTRKPVNRTIPAWTPHNPPAASSNWRARTTAPTPAASMSLSRTAKRSA